MSAFYYADKLFTPLTTSVLYSISAVMFPRFNREFTREDAKGYALKCLRNIACAGKFSSDRSVQDYAEKIWKL